MYMYNNVTIVADLKPFTHCCYVFPSLSPSPPHTAATLPGGVGRKKRGRGRRGRLAHGAPPTRGGFQGDSSHGNTLEPPTAGMSGVSVIVSSSTPDEEWATVKKVQVVRG